MRLSASFFLSSGYASGGQDRMLGYAAAVVLVAMAD